MHQIERAELQALVKLAIASLSIGAFCLVPSVAGERWVRRHVVRLHHRTPRRYAVNLFPGTRMLRVTRLDDRTDTEN